MTRNTTVFLDNTKSLYLKIKFFVIFFSKLLNFTLNTENKRDNSGLISQSQFTPACDHSLTRFNPTTCFSRVYRTVKPFAQKRHVHEKHTAPLNEWRLTNLTFRGIPLRGHQCRAYLTPPCALPPSMAVRAFSFSSPPFRIRCPVSPLLLAPARCRQEFPLLYLTTSIRS